MSGPDTPFRQAFDELARLMAEAPATLLPDLQRAAEHCATCLAAGGKLLAAGNGGSAAQAQHLAAELVGRFQRDRRALSALALTTDGSTLTAVGNDYGFERVFARQIEALAQPSDLLIVLSTSGTSPNLIAAATSAREIGCKVVAFTGAGGGKLSGLADVALAVPSESVPRIQELHQVCLHLLAGYLEHAI